MEASQLIIKQPIMKLVSGRRGTPAAKTRRKTGQKGPGRPEGTSVVRDDILDAAEELFANLGYAGTTLREVADQANVTQALINYYFGSKYGLFEAVFMRRSQIISQQRIENLARLQAKPGKPKVRDIVQAFLMPHWLSAPRPKVARFCACRRACTPSRRRSRTSCGPTPTAAPPASTSKRCARPCLTCPSWTRTGASR